MIDFGCMQDFQFDIWKPLELVGFTNPFNGSTKSNYKNEKTENDLASFANKNNQIVIAGHTHRPVFSKPGEGLYFNDGSCIHPRCITGIEIENNEITLIKWAILTREDRTLYVEREVLEGPISLFEYYNH